MPTKGWKQAGEKMWTKKTPTTTLIVEETQNGDWRAEYIECNWRRLQIDRVPTRDEAMKVCERKAHES